MCDCVCRGVVSLLAKRPTNRVQRARMIFENLCKVRVPYVRQLSLDTK
jgi:hypothetical protein